MQGKLLFTLTLAGALAACGGGGAAPLTGEGPGTDALATLALSHPEGAVPVGDTIVLQVEAKDGGGKPVSGAQPQFASSDATVASVDGAGAVRGLKAGAASITASLTVAGITKTATFGVAVLAATQPPSTAIAAFALDPASVTVAPGGTAQLEPVATDASGARVASPADIAWSVQDGTRASVAGGVVTGIAAGATSVTASFTADGRAWPASASVTVTQASSPSTATVRGIDDAFSPSTVTIAAGGTVTWTMVDEEHDVTWTGPAPAGGNIGRMDRGASASRTFSAAGTYAYTCSRHDGRHGGLVVVDGAAQDPVFTSVRITPASPSVAVGATVQLAATPLDQAGRAMTGLPAPQWTSADAAKATVTAGGVVTGVAAGTVAITARITQGGVTREASVSVAVGSTTQPPVPTTATVTTPGTTFNPASVTIAAGGSVTWQFTGSTRHNVTFNGTAPAGGNIPDTDPGGSATRQFATAGTYAYTCTRHAGMNGTVVVQQ